MSLVRIIDVPEVEMEVSKLITQMLHLCQGYTQAQMRFYSDELNLPHFGRLFELIRQLEMNKIEEFIRFQVSRGQRITWFDVKPVDNIEKAKPVEIVRIILDLEKGIHQSTLHLINLGWNKLDLALTTFLQQKLLLRQVKVIRKRADQLRDLRRSEDEVTPFLTSRLNVRREVEKLEKRLRLEVTSREWGTHETREEETISMIESTWQF